MLRRDDLLTAVRNELFKLGGTVVVTAREEPAVLQVTFERGDQVYTRQFPLADIEQNGVRHVVDSVREMMHQVG